MHVGAQRSTDPVDCATAASSQRSTRSVDCATAATAASLLLLLLNLVDFLDFLSSSYNSQEREVPFIAIVTNGKQIVMNSHLSDMYEGNVEIQNNVPNKQQIPISSTSDIPTAQSSRDYQPSQNDNDSQYNTLVAPDH